MKEIVLKNAKKKFDEVRDTCPGMRCSMYYLTDFISLICNDNLVPSDLSAILTMIYEGLRDGDNIFNEPEFNYLLVHRFDTLTEIFNVPQVVDVIADRDFARQFRKMQKEFYGILPPVRIHIDLNLPYAENVIIAVNWWLDAIMKKNKKEFDHSKIMRFRKRLASIIAFDLEYNGKSIIKCEDVPSFNLISAGLELGLGMNSDNYPDNTKMYVDYTTLKVMKNSKEEILWSYEADEDIKVKQKRLK